MPAVTVDDLTVLPRLHAPGLGDTVRPVRGVTLRSTHAAAPAGYPGINGPLRLSQASSENRSLHS